MAPTICLPARSYLTLWQKLVWQQPVWTFQALGQQHCQNPGEKDAIEGPRSANGGHGCPKALEVAKIQQIRAKQSAQAADDIG